MEQTIRTLTREDVPEIGSVVDITPTILALLDIPVGRDMDGTVLIDLFRPTYSGAVKVRFVDTHDTAQWLSSRRKIPQAAPGTAERVEQLRALGYLSEAEDEVDDQDRSQEKPPLRR